MFGYIEVGLHGGIDEIKCNFVQFPQFCPPFWLFASPVNVAMDTTMFLIYIFRKIICIISFQKIFPFVT